MASPFTTVMDVDELLENALRENALREKAQNDARKAAADRASKSGSEGRRSDERDRKDDRDRGRDRDRDRRGGGNLDRYRESNNERHRSRDRDNRRRDGSRPRSSYKDADIDDEELPIPMRPRDGRDRDRSRDRYRDRGSRRDDRRGDFYSGGGRARSRSPRDSRRHRDDRDKAPRSDRDRSRERRRDDRRPSRRTGTPTTPAEPEPTEDDRDKRTIFVQQISQRAEIRHLRIFFEAVGPVVEAQIVKDRVTGRSKGVGYVEFKEEASVPKAIELTGQKLKGVPIIAQHTEAEKNRASRAAAADSNAMNNNGAPFHRLYVGNIHFSVTEADLSTIFEPYGELEQVTLQREEASNGGRSKGYGFVQFRDPSAARSALEQMNNFELANRPIRVGLGNDKFTPESTASLLRNFNSQAQNFQGSAFSGAGGRGAYAGGSGGVFDRTHGRDHRGVSGASALDDTDVAGININNMNRERLMNMLARTEVPEPAKSRNGQLAAKPRAPAYDQPQPSKCVKIQNAFDPAEELNNYGVDWMKALEKEVRGECDAKYGKVVHMAVDPNSDGDIFVKFDSVTGGEKAMQGLNGRTFNYRVIRASYVVDKIYNSLYGAAASKF